MIPKSSIKFYWHVLKDDGVAIMLEKFHTGSSRRSLNFGTIILLPKNNDMKQIRQCRPIYLLNVYFKNYIPMVDTNKLMKAAQQITKLSQVAFLLGRNIIEGTFFFYEIIHTKNKLVFQIDIEVYVNSYTTRSKNEGFFIIFGASRLNHLFKEIM